MMNLAIMRELVAEAEEGDRAMATAAAAARRWGFDAGSLIDWRYSANAVYRFDQAGEHRFLRLTPLSERDPEQTLAELDFISYLAEEEIPAARPLRSASGSWLEEIVSPHGPFSAVVFEEAPGRPADLETLEPALVRLWGESLADLHCLSEKYRPRPGRRRRSWLDDLDQTAARLGPEQEEAQRLLSLLADWLGSLPSGEGEKGLIHYDFELDNLRWDGGRFRVFDFDDAAYYWYAADVAFALDDVRDLEDGRRELVVAEFLAGYRQVRPLAPEWEARLPRFLLLMDLLKYGRVLAAYRGADPALDRPWLAGLRERHASWLAEKRTEFAGLA